MSHTAGPIKYSAVPYPERCQLPGVAGPLSDLYVVMFKEPRPVSLSATNRPSPLAKPKAVLSGLRSKAQCGPDILSEIEEGIEDAAAVIPPLERKHVVDRDPIMRAHQRRQKRWEKHLEESVGEGNDVSVVDTLRQVVVDRQTVDYFCPSCTRRHEVDAAMRHDGYCRSCYRCPTCGSGASVAECRPAIVAGQEGQPQPPPVFRLTCTACHWRSAAYPSVRELASFLNGLAAKAVAQPHIIAARQQLSKKLNPPTVSAVLQEGIKSGRWAADEKALNPPLSGIELFDWRLQRAQKAVDEDAKIVATPAKSLAELAAEPFDEPIPAPYANTQGTALPQQLIAPARVVGGRDTLQSYYEGRAVRDPNGPKEGLLFCTPLVPRPALKAKSESLTIMNESLVTLTEAEAQPGNVKVFPARSLMCSGATSTYCALKLLPQLSAAWTSSVAAATSANSPGKGVSQDGSQTMFFYLANRSPFPLTLLDVLLHHADVPGYNVKLFAATHMGSPRRIRSTDSMASPPTTPAVTAASPSGSRASIGVANDSISSAGSTLSAFETAGMVNLISTATGVTLAPYTKTSNPQSYHVDQTIATKVAKSVGAFLDESRLVFGLTLTKSAEAGSPPQSPTHRRPAGGVFNLNGPTPRKSATLMITCRVPVPLDIGGGKVKSESCEMTFYTTIGIN